MIYQGSAINICGPGASDSSSGFLQPRIAPPPRYWNCRNKLVTIRPCSHLQHWAIQREGDCPCQLYLTAKGMNSTMTQRGWILQEYLLSPRTLFFGQHRMYRESFTHSHFEDDLDFSVNSDSDLDEFGFGRTHSSIQKGEQVDFLQSDHLQNEGWQNAVHEYTSRKLTIQGDRLPALSGIASYTLRGCESQYLAGIIS